MMIVRRARLCARLRRRTELRHDGSSSEERMLLRFIRQLELSVGVFRGPLRSLSVIKGYGGTFLCWMRSR